MEELVHVGLQGSPDILPALLFGLIHLAQEVDEWQTEGVSQVEVYECSTQQCSPYAVELFIIQVIWIGYYAQLVVCCILQTMPGDSKL